LIFVENHNLSQKFNPWQKEYIYIKDSDTGIIKQAQEKLFPFCMLSKRFILLQAKQSRHRTEDKRKYSKLLGNKIHLDSELVQDSTAIFTIDN
jgi:hypothetical protein